MSVVNTASKMLAGVQPKSLPTAGGVNVLSTISLTTSLALNDIINMLALGADVSDPNGLGPTIIGMTLDVDKLDSNASPTIKLNVGDTLTNASTAANFFSQITTAQAGGYAIPNIPAVLGYQPFAGQFNTYPTPSQMTDTIYVKVQTAAATPQAGNLRLLVEYSFDS